MRLHRETIRPLLRSVRETFGADAEAWLFGSRIDDSRRGGDFDFYVETDIGDPKEVIDHKLELLAQLHATPDFEGEKIDLIIKPALPGPYPPIYEQARRQGVPL